MFAEELSGNASKKRQDRAKERRRQIKERQRQSVSSQRGSVGAATVVTEKKASESSSKIASAPTSDGIAGSAAPFVSSLPSDTSKKASVAVTLEKRRLRQELQHQQRCVVVIQSLFRARRSNRILQEQQRSVLNRCLADLVTLRALLKKAGNQADYVPPPATASALVRQLLFVARTIPLGRKGDTDEFRLRGEEDMRTVYQLFSYVLLPGLLNKDSHLDPILPWLTSPDGRVRLLRLLRFSLVVATTRGATNDALGAVQTFLRAVLGLNGGVSDDVVRPCRSLFLPETQRLESGGSTGVEPENLAIGKSLDLIHELRNHLLFHVGHSDPIPPSAERMREACIPQKERERADVLFQLTLDAVLTRHSTSDFQALQSRFVAEIFTVPLLSWKVTSDSVSKLLAVAPSGFATKPVASFGSLVFICLLQSFVARHSTALSTGEVAHLLPVLDIRRSPAVNVQVMLANLLQIGRICPSINGSDPTKVDYTAGSLFFNVIATLVDVVPLSTLSSKETSVEWVSDGKAHHSPIVLSPVIIDQCKLLLVDSYVRNLFNAAIDDISLDTDRVLSTKNDSDLKDEKALNDAGTASATNLAAKEAKMDRTKGFWQSSKWARKLSTSMSKMLTGDNVNRKPNSQPKEGLVNTSSVSLKLARGDGKLDRQLADAVSASRNAKLEVSTAAAERPRPMTYSLNLFVALARTYGIVLARWGGGGKDIAKLSSGKSSNERYQKDKVSPSADPCTLSLLNAICFSTNVVSSSWGIIQSDKSIAADIFALIDSDESLVSSTNVVPKFTECSQRGRAEQGSGAALLYLFVRSLSHVLIVTDDVEIHELDNPLPLHQLRRCIRVLKKLLKKACYADSIGSSAAAKTNQVPNYFGLALTSSSSRTMRDLYDRSSRRPLCVPKLWIVNDLLDKEIRRCKSHESYVALLSNPVLRVCPFLVSFKRRLKLFERIVATNRLNVQGSAEFFSQKPGLSVRIVRGRVLEDGLATLNKLGRNLRQRIIVQYVNEAGAKEVGVDAGGLFKEFWTDLSELAFDPNYALFRVTEGAGNCLYPNPSSSAAHGPDHITLFEFLGRILGKALYEGITIHPQFAHVFLSFLRGDYNYLHMLSDLSTMDPQLYNNLMFLKTYDGDARDLSLTFTVAIADFGKTVEVPLIPKGGDVEVTNENKQRYIGLVAKHHVCDRLREQSEAFTRGLWDVIDKEWLCLFNEPELQVLISGSSDGTIDIADMRSNTRYIGFTGIDRNINRFWKVVSTFSTKQQADLLRFVTSCERPPPLGFASMNPPFTIQRVGIISDGDKLPTASTCFNTLKLPSYSSEKIMRERLLYAIESGAGFELT